MGGRVITTWTWLWLLAAILLVVGGALNLSQRATYKLPPTDGVTWAQQGNDIVAKKIEPNSAAARAQMTVGDKLIAISLDGKNFDEVAVIPDIYLYLEQAGTGGSLTYYFQHPSYSYENSFYYADLTNLDAKPRWTPTILFLSLVGAVYLGIGLFVLLKQGDGAPFVLHFAVLCLTAFVFHFYKPVGAFEDLDLAVAILDDAAFALFVPLFWHFCLRYPSHPRVFGNNKWKTLSLYVPAFLLIAATVFSYTPLLSYALDPNQGVRFIRGLYVAVFAYFGIGLAVGSGVLIWRFLKTQQPLVRQRLKWVIWGTVAAVTPLTLYYVAKLFTEMPEDGWEMGAVILPLALIPISFGHSVVRYRLMDVDIVVRRTLIYALTTMTIAALIGTLILGLVFFIIGDGNSATENALRLVIAIVAMAVIVMLSEPIKHFLQERADRFFYGERYDLRRGLLDFGRTLSVTTALDPLLNALVSRLQQVLNVERIAVFIEDEKEESGYRLARAVNLSENLIVPPDFRQFMRTLSSQNQVVRADDLESNETDTQQIRQELHYYVPCVARGKMVAVIGLGRTNDGSLLSSDDLEILRTVSGYVAVAIENSLLYQEQQRRAAELELLKEFNESIVESVNVGLMAVDENGFVTRCNTTLEDLLGINRDEALGKRVEDLFGGDFADVLTALLGKSKWRLTELRHAYKLRAMTLEGHNLILNVAIAPLRTLTKEKTGAIVVLEDVTNRVRLEEQLQQREKLSSIGLLAAGVAHEVNTPLTGVSSYTQMLLNMFPENDPKHALLEKVQRQTERATNIVGNLLNFSRAGSSGDFTEINLNRVLEDTLQLLEVQLRRSNIELMKEFSQSLPTIYGNAGKLQQVFTNLILNARDAINGHGGQIKLKTRTTSDGVTIEVADNGEGIPPENLSKIYDPFFTTKAVGQGTGLGLAVSYGIIQEHAGEINVESEPGQTIFRLTFPISKPQQQAAAS
jgi:hypothetical protein